MKELRKGEYYTVNVFHDSGRPTLYLKFNEWKVVDPAAIDLALFAKQRENPEEEQLRRKIYNALKDTIVYRPFQIMQTSVERKYRGGIYPPITIDDAFDSATSTSHAGKARETNFILLIATLIVEEEDLWDFFTNCDSPESLIARDPYVRWERLPTGRRMLVKTEPNEPYKYRRLGGYYESSVFHFGKKARGDDIYADTSCTGLWIIKDV